MNKALLIKILMLMLSYFGSPVAIVFGASLEFLTTCYTSDELQQLKKWEELWAGKKIDKNNVEHVAEFLPDSYVAIYQSPESWGAPGEGFYFYIVPYQRAGETSGMAAATKKYAPAVTMDSAGRLLRYTDIAGRPFPDPKTGLEIAWNFDFNTHGDGCFYNRTGYNIIPAKKTERVGDQDGWELFWIHRVDVDPRPAFQHNPKRHFKINFLSHVLASRI